LLGVAAVPYDRGPLKRLRPLPALHAATARPALPIDVFVTGSCVIAIFADRGPREYATLADLLAAFDLREGDLVEVPPSTRIRAVDS